MQDTVGLVFYIITFITVATALCLNSLGVHLLMSIKSTNNIANLVLIHLSCLKIFISLTEAALSTLELLNRGYEFKEYQIMDILNAGLYGVNDLIVVVLTTDRLIAATRPLTYSVRITKTKLNAAVGCCWFIGTCGILPFFFLEYDFLYDIYYKIVFLTLDAFVLMTAVITYGAILRKLLSRHNALDVVSRATMVMTSISQRPRSVSNRMKHGRFFYVSSLIIASFILFVAIPDSVYVALVVIQGNEDPIIERSIGFVWGLYLVADPIIYIFLQRSIRKRLAGMISRHQANGDPPSATTLHNERTKPLRYETKESDVL